MSDPVAFLEYEPTAESGYWRMERPDLLEADFGVTRAEVEEWHRWIAGKGRVWEIVRRIYQVAGMWEDDPDVLVSWTRAEVAKKFGIPAAEVDHDLKAAVDQWRLHIARAQVARESVRAADGGAAMSDVDSLVGFTNAAGLEQQSVDKLLAAFNFSDIKDELLRAQVANRIISLREYLESPHSRTSARQIIRLEVSMHGKEKMLLIYNNKIEQIAEEDPELRSRKGDMDEFRLKAKDLDAEMRAMTKAHSDLLKEIGADDIDMTTRKRMAVETVGYIMNLCRVYESDPENVLVDGVFRANELDWLMEPEGERTPQYRPDISIRLREALLPENLWDPHYKPTKIQMRVTQELRKMVACMRAIPEDAEPLLENDGDEDEDALAAAGGVPMMDDVQAVAAVDVPQIGQARKNSGAPMGVF